MKIPVFLSPVTGMKSEFKEKTATEAQVTIYVIEKEGEKKREKIAETSEGEIVDGGTVWGDNFVLPVRSDREQYEFEVQFWDDERTEISTLSFSFFPLSHLGESETEMKTCQLKSEDGLSSSSSSTSLSFSLSWHLKQSSTRKIKKRRPLSAHSIQFSSIPSSPMGGSTRIKGKKMSLPRPDSPEEGDLEQKFVIEVRNESGHWLGCVRSLKSGKYDLSRDINMDHLSSATSDFWFRRERWKDKSNCCALKCVSDNRYISRSFINGKLQSSNERDPIYISEGNWSFKKKKEQRICLLDSKTLLLGTGKHNVLSLKLLPV